MTAPLPHLLFVLGQLSVGGIETYVVRMVRAYNKAGGKVSIWVIKHLWDPELLSLLRAVADVRFIASATLPYPAWVRTPKVPESVDLVFTTGRLSLIFAAYACYRAKRPVRLVAGVFSQWEFCSDENNLKSMLAADILRKIGPLNTVFCTEGCRRDHQEKLGDQYLTSKVSPLLVELPNMPKTRPLLSNSQLRIVSVSRLVSFKTSNQQMPEVIRHLVDKGVDVSWTHYGEGPERAAIETAIIAAGVASRSFLAGAIPYSDLYGAIARADLYIGGGTTLIEAAALSVPALVALDENPMPTTPGFFSERKGHFTSDIVDNEELESMADVIERFWKLSASDREEYRRKSFERAQEYSTKNSVPEIQSIIEVSKVVQIERLPFFQIKYILSNIFEISRLLLIKLNMISNNSTRRR